MTYLTIINEQARRNKLFLKLDELLKNLKNKKFWAKQDIVAITNIISKAKKVEQSIKLLKVKKKAIFILQKVILKKMQIY